MLARFVAETNTASATVSCFGCRGWAAGQANILRSANDRRSPAAVHLGPDVHATPPLVVTAIRGDELLAVDAGQSSLGSPARPFHAAGGSLLL